MSHTLRRHVLLALAAGALSPLPGLAQQGTWPERPIKIVVPYGAGGSVDAIGRTLAQELSSRLGQPVVVENRTGAGSNVGSAYVAKSPPDGYTLLLTSPGNAINVTLFKQMPYDVRTELTQVAVVGRAPGIVLVRPDFPANNVKELVALARKEPGKLNFGSGGPGSSEHLAGEMFKTVAGIDMTHVPYKGAGPAVQDIMAGHATTGIHDLASVGPHVASGKVIALAVTGPRRWPALPDLPTFAELGYPLDIAGWNAIHAPAGTSRPIVERMSAEINRVIQSPEGREQMLKFGLLATGTTPDELGAIIRRDTPRWGEVIRKAAIKAQ